VPAFFALTLFVSATLLFMVQPMVGKMVLPLLGGGAGVWNTCMLFFQALLLLGYLYAHKLSGIASIRKQVTIHIGVLLTTAAVMGIGIALTEARTPIPIVRSLSPQGSSFPFVNVLAMLLLAIGLPFFALSTSAPLLQRWFSATGHPSSKDPYFLYAASNAGSLLSLLAYPMVTEPSLLVIQQTWLFGAGFLLLLGLTLQCGRAACNPLRAPEPTKTLTDRKYPELTHSIPLARRLRWLGWAFVPSSLMLGVTTHMTTDIASVPMLWVIPLALYLLTFIIAFATTPSWFRPVLANVSPVATLILVFVITSQVRGLSTFALLALHLGAYFLAALLMHSELARDRPDAKHLTEFYLWMSVGGMLGGLFNAIVAPLFLPYTYEYPIAIAIGCMLIPSFSDAVDDNPKVEKPKTADNIEKEKFRSMMRVVLDGLIPLMMMIFVAALYAAQGRTFYINRCNDIADAIGWVFRQLGTKSHVDWKTVRLFFTYAPPCMACFLFIDRPLRFGLCVAAVLFVFYLTEAKNESTKFTTRSFYGILKVNEFTDTEVERTFFRHIKEMKTDDGEIEYDVHSKGGYELHYVLNVLAHGTTTHGSQFSGPFRIQMYSKDNGPIPEAMTSGSPPMLSDHLQMLGSAAGWAAGATGWEALALVGAQASWDNTKDPLTYYHRTGPVGDMFSESFRRTREKSNRLPNVGMVGLGTGSVSCYAIDGMNLTFYEIDPSVIDMVEKPTRVMNAKDVKLGKPPIYGPFTYIDDARNRGAKIDFILGDARLKLEEPTDKKYDLLLIDAFSSDSIPIHLLTVESLRLYEKRLAENGLLALHISNRYIQLEPVVAAIAKEVGLTCRVCRETILDTDHLLDPKKSTSTLNPGKTSSSWVVLTRNASELGRPLGEASKYDLSALVGGTAIAFSGRWDAMEILDGVPAWTDDYANVPSVIRSKEFQWFRRQLGFKTPVTD